MFTFGNTRPDGLTADAFALRPMVIFFPLDERDGVPLFCFSLCLTMGSFAMCSVLIFFAFSAEGGVNDNFFPAIVTRVKFSYIINIK